MECISEALLQVEDVLRKWVNQWYMCLGAYALLPCFFRPRSNVRTSESVRMVNGMVSMARGNTLIKSTNRTQASGCWMYCHVWRRC